MSLSCTCCGLICSFGGLSGGGARCARLQCVCDKHYCSTMRSMFYNAFHQYGNDRSPLSALQSCP
jgi:hypothetical protein